MISLVKRNVNSLLCSRIKQSFAYRVFSYGTNKIDLLNALDRFLPGLAEVARAKNMRAQIVEVISIDRRISGTGIKMRRFYNADRAPLRYARRSDVLPRRSTVLRQLDVPIIRSNPDEAFLNF